MYLFKASQYKSWVVIPFGPLISLLSGKSLIFLADFINGEKIPNAPNKAGDLYKLMKQQYDRISDEQNEKIISGFQKFIDFSHRPDVTLKAIIREAAMLIYRLFPFKEITMGLKSPVDGKYRYEEIVGHSKKASDALKKLSYTYDEFFSPKDYPSIWLSKYTQLALLEDRPYLEIEKDTYNRPVLLYEARKSLDDFVEGDYFDVYIFGDRDEMIGWIEVSATKNGKMPAIILIKQLELFASILSNIIQPMMVKRKIE